MAKKNKNKKSIFETYIENERNTAKLFKSIVYGVTYELNGEIKKLCNFNLDKEFDYHCPTRSTSIKIKGEYLGSGTYRSYWLLDRADRALLEADLFEDEEFQEMFNSHAIKHGYKSGEELLKKSMNYDETAQTLREELVNKSFIL